MALKEAMISYKYKKLATRLAIMAAVGAAYPAYMFYEQNPQIEEEINVASADLETAKAKLADAERKKAELPNRLKELDRTKTDFETARTKLVGIADMDDLLRKTALAAEDQNVVVSSFTPQAAIEEGGRVRYTKQQIDLTLKGKFIPVTRFLDSVLNFGPLVYITGISYAQTTLTNESARDQGLDPAVDPRTLVGVSTDIKMLIFRKMAVN